MKRSISFAIVSSIVLLTANFSQAQVESTAPLPETEVIETTAVFDVPAIMKKAAAIPIQKCELNDGNKGWTEPDLKPIRLAVYRCFAQDDFSSAVFTQIPDGSKEFPKEFVDYCEFSNQVRRCELVPIDRPATRTSDLKRFKIVERIFKDIRCRSKIVNGEPIHECDEPAEKFSTVKK